MFQVNIADWMANGKCFTKCHTTLGLWYVITVILLIRPNLSGSPILPLLLFDATVSVNIANARFYHNAGKCEQFIYGGCRGNENNFASLEACQVPGDFWNVSFNLIFFTFFSSARQDALPVDRGPPKKPSANMATRASTEGTSSSWPTQVRSRSLWIWLYVDDGNIGALQTPRQMD